VKKPTAERIQEAKSVISRLLDEYKTVSFATVNAQGHPLVSYAPAALDEDRNFYLFVSELSEHTSNLQGNGLASIMVLDDESRSTQLFARNRLNMEGRVCPVSRESADWPEASRVYRERFGKFFDQLAQLKDFHMFCFKPETARVVIGFGAAFQIDLPDWDRLELVTGK
jgi:heme oxygenase (biliverdin-IX-beta and delta-forming)